MQETKFAPSNNLMHAATAALAGRKGHKALHIHIEPTENDGFIAHHQDHEDGDPVGKVRKHSISSVRDLAKHVQDAYKSPLLERIKAEGAEAEAGETKQPEAVRNAAEGE
jgi:hypothetical protein